MADVRVDVELTTSLKGVQTELAKVLRPIEQLLQKLSGNATLDLQLTKQGAGLVSKQLEEFAAKAGIDPKEAKKLGEAFRVFVADIDRYLRSVRRGELEEAGRRLDSAMKSLQTFTEGIAAWDEKLKSVALPTLKLVTRRGGKPAIDPDKIVKAVEAIEVDLGRFFTDRVKKEAQELRKQLYLRLQSIKHDASKGNLEEAKQALEGLYKELKTSGALPDPRTLKDIQKVLRDLRKQVNDLVAKTAEEVQRLAKEYLVSSTLPKLAPGVDPDALFRAYSYLGGSRQALLDAFYNTLIKQDPFGNMAVGQTAKGLQKTVSWLVGNIEQEMVLGLMTSEYGRDLIAAKGQQAFLEQLSAAYSLLSNQLLHAKPEELRRTADMFLKDAQAAKAKFNIALEDVRGIGIALKAVADHLQTYSVMEKLALHTYSNLLNERAEGNPLTGAYRYGRQQALDTRHEDYLRAFLPGLYKRYQQLRDQGDPRALTFRADVISRLGTSIDAMHGLLLNSLANFVSGIGIGVFFGTVYAVSQYVQQMRELNKQLLAYKKILEMRGEQSMAESVSALRDRLLELAKASGVAVEEVARLFGTVARNGMSTDGLERLLAVMGRLNEVFGIPFDALRKDVAETLLQHRQYFLGPDTISRVLEYGGPQADKALNIFNELLKTTNSAAFSFDELAKAVRYYLDTGKPVKDSFYEIAKAVQYGGTVAEAMAEKLHQMAQETVNFGQILTRGDEYQDNLQRLQKQLGLTISALGHDIMAGFGIGEASTFMVTLQAMLTGFLALVKGLQDFINAIMNLKVIGPILQAALAVLTGTGITALVISMFRLLAIFAARVVESVVATTAILRSANLTTGLATATNLLVALRGNLVKFFASLGAVIATAGTGAMNLLRTGGLTALAGGALATVRGGVGAALAGGAALLRAIPGIGWIALGATTLVGAGMYIASKNAQRRNEEANKALESSSRLTSAFNRVEQSGSVVKLFTPDNTTKTPTYTIDLEKLRSKDAIDKMVAYMLGKLQGADKLVYEHVVNLMRSLNIQDKTSLEQYRKQLDAEIKELVAKYEEAKKAGDKALMETYNAQILKLRILRSVVDTAGEAYITAVQRASGVMRQDETRSALNAQYQAKLNEYAEKMDRMLDSEKIDFQKKIAEELIKATVGDVRGKSLFAVDVIQPLLDQTLENLERELSDRLLKAESLSTETARNAAKRAAYSWYISQLQAERSKLASFFKNVGLDPNLATRLFGLLHVKTREAQAQLGQVNRQMQDLQRSIADAGAQAVQQLDNVMKEAFYGASSTPNLTAKLLATAESILNTTANDAPEKAAIVAKQVNDYIAKNLTLAQEYDRQVQTMLNEFAIAKRVSNPEKRFENLKRVVQKYLSEYPKRLKEMPGLASQIADQLEAALYKDGGMLSAISSLTDSTVKELKRVAERQKDYGPFNDLGRFIEVLAEGVNTLTKVSVMTTEFRKLSADYRKLLESVRLNQVTSVDKLIAISRETLRQYKSLPNLSEQDKAYIALLEGYIENLERQKQLLIDLDNANKQLAKFMPGTAEHIEWFDKKIQIERQLASLRGEADKRLQDISTWSNQLEDALTDYVSSLNEALKSLLDSLNGELKNITKQLQEQQKRVQNTLQAYLQRGTRLSPVEEELRAFNELTKALADEYEQLNQLAEALATLRKTLATGQTAALRQALELLAKGEKPKKETSENVRAVYSLLESSLALQQKEESDKKLQQMSREQYIKTKAGELLKSLTQGLDKVNAFLNEVDTRIQEQKAYLAETEEKAKKHNEALLELARVRTTLQNLLERKTRLLQLLAASDELEQYEAEVNYMLNSANALKAHVGRIKAANPELDTRDVEDQLSEVERIVSDYFSAKVDQVMKKLPQPSDIFVPSAEDYQSIVKALDTLEQLDQAIYSSKNPEVIATLKGLRERLTEALLGLAKEDFNSFVNLLATSPQINQAALDKLQVFVMINDIRKQIQRLGEGVDFKPESLDDVGKFVAELEARKQKAAQLSKTINALASSGKYRPETIEDLQKELVQSVKRLEDAEKALYEQADNLLLNSAKEMADKTVTSISLLLKSGGNINDAVKAYNEALDNLAKLTPYTDKGKSAIDDLKRELTTNVISLLVDNAIENLPNPSAILEYTDNEIQRVVDAFDLIDLLDALEKASPDEKTKLALLEARKKPG
jgi:hypothetical protein